MLDRASKVAAWCYVALQDVTYTVQAKAGREKITILEGLQGFFEPGKITAVVSATLV